MELDTILLVGAAILAALFGPPSILKMRAARQQSKAIDKANAVIEDNRQKAAEREAERHEERQAEANAEVAAVNEADDLQELADIANRRSKFGKES